MVFSPPEQTAGPETIGRGHRLYQDICMGCHGLNAVSGLLVSDLRGSAHLHDEAGWNAVVLQGALSNEGMPSVASLIDADDSEAIRAYVVEQSWRAKRLQQQP